MKIFLQYSMVIVFYTFFVSNLEGSQQFIVLTHAKSEAAIADKKVTYEQIIAKDQTLSQLKKDQRFTAKIKKVSIEYLLEVDGFQKDSEMILTYLTLKEHFPQAFIANKPRRTSTQKMSQYIPKEISIEEKSAEKDDALSWIAIFSLALVGIFSLFISSIEMKKINKKYEKMQEKQHSIELFLTQMGENIYRLTREAIKEDEKNLHKEQDENIALKSVKNRLFDETRMMIYFLRLKSKKLKITQESFNLNTMLSNILGTLSSNFKDSNIELIFDIDHEVPKVIVSDLLHLSEILIELLQNAMQNSINDQVQLKIFLNTKNKLVFQITDTGLGIDRDELENLFIPTYTKDGIYKGVGLFVANELTTMMGGELYIDQQSSSGVIINCALPIIDIATTKEKRKYRLPNRTYIQKRVLLCEEQKDAAKAIKKMLKYFRYEVKVISHKELEEGKINLSRFDLIMGDIERFDVTSVDLIQEIRRDYPLKVVNLSSIFSTKKIVKHEYIDEYLKKPFSQERLRDLIIVLFGESSEKSSVVAKAKNRVESVKVIPPKEIRRTKDIVTGSFKKFAGSHILVVEDSFIDQKLFQNIFEKSDIRMTLATNGKEALELLKNKKANYDLVLMDISMPIMDGYDAIAQIRDNSNYDHLPIVASTSMTLDSEIKKMFDSGANAYLRKPLDTGYLYTILDKFIGKEKVDKVSKVSQKSKSKKLQTIDGLDFRKGIKLANGSEELYKEVLNEFVTAYGDSGDTIRRMVEEDRYQQAKRLCLDMKGLTSTIGAYEMFDIVDSMYKQYIYNNLHLIPKFVETYNDGLVKLLAAIEYYKSES